jgi:hypothetical protein
VERDGVHGPGVHEQDRDRSVVDHCVAGEVFHPGMDPGELLDEQPVGEQVVDKHAVQEFARVYSFRQVVSGEPSTEAGRAGLPAAWARKGELRSSMFARWGLPGLGARAKSRPIAGPSADVAGHPRADKQAAGEERCFDAPPSARTVGNPCIWARHTGLSEAASLAGSRFFSDVRCPLAGEERTTLGQALVPLYLPDADTLGG